MKLVTCEVSKGARDGFKTVGVQSVEGFIEYFSIEERFLFNENGEYLLPARVISTDSRYKTSLIQLPVEADSGANRVWISGNLIQEKDKVIA